METNLRKALFIILSHRNVRKLESSRYNSKNTENLTKHFLCISALILHFMFPFVVRPGTQQAWPLLCPARFPVRTPQQAGPRAKPQQTERLSIPHGITMNIISENFCSGNYMLNISPISPLWHAFFTSVSSRIITRNLESLQCLYRDGNSHTFSRKTASYLLQNSWLERIAAETSCYRSYDRPTEKIKRNTLRTDFSSPNLTRDCMNKGMKEFIWVNSHLQMFWPVLDIKPNFNSSTLCWEFLLPQQRYLSCNIT